MAIKGARWVWTTTIYSCSHAVHQCEHRLWKTFDGGN